jgi:AcrR family transcriptional regulator
MAGSKLANKASPRRTAPAAKSGPEALLLAAERLFAEHGMENVSMRQIVSAAGQANHYAVQHHFGDESGLIRAILEMRLPEVNAIRARMLRSCARSKNLDTRALVRALFLPLAQFVDDGGRHTHARFMLRLQERDPSASFMIEFQSQAPTATDVVAILRERLPDVPASLFVLRLRLASNMFLHAIAALDTPSGLAGMSPNTYLAHAIDACISILTQPAPASRR